jgi:hypothetical protein
MRHLLSGKKATLLILLLGAAAAGLSGWFPGSAEASVCYFYQSHTERYYSDATYTQQVGFCTYNCQTPNGRCFGQITEYQVYEEGEICTRCIG